MANQHATVTQERWLQFSLDQQILMIANEMNRATKFLESVDGDHLRNCYERILNLTDLTIRVNSRPALRRELLRWRDLIAEFFISTEPDTAGHKEAFKVLLSFTPESWKQRQYVLI